MSPDPWRALLLLRTSAKRLADQGNPEWLQVASAVDLLAGVHTVEPFCASCGGSMPPPRRMGRPRKVCQTCRPPRLAANVAPK